MTLRYGIIGSGMMGQEHIRNIKLLEATEIVAVADPDEGMRTSAADLAGPGCKTFADHRDLLGADLCDVIVIAAPNDLHHRLLKDVMATDRPILVEKPVCSTVADSKDILAMADRRQAPVWVAMEYRYMPPVARLISETHAGRFGTPKMIAIREHRYPFLDKVGHWNRFNRRSGGTLVEKCCHFFDLMRLLARSEAVRVYASGALDVNYADESYEDGRPDILDNAFVILDFENGMRAMLDLCMFAEGSYWQERISVTGSTARGEAFVPGPARFSPDGRERHAEFAVATRETRQEVREIVPVDPEILAAGDHHGSTFYQHRHFREMVLTGGKPAVTVEDGFKSVLIGAAAETSARTGMAVDLTS